MTLNVEEMRRNISDVYPYPSWREKCARMQTSQVIAIYHSFCRYGKFDPVAPKKSKNEEYKQLDIFDVWGKEVVT